MTTIKDKLTVVKVGGAVVESHESLEALLASFATITGFKILVHGGGRSATSIASQLGIETVMVGGRRITDNAMLDVVTMVYGGLVNKRIVARLQAMGIDALGVTGADMDIIRSHKRPVTPEGIDFGYVGDVDHINANALSAIVRTGIVPVVAPLTHDGQGQLLNTNADTMAAAVATGMASDYDVRLVYCFEKPGVLLNPDNDESLITSVTRSGFDEMRRTGIVSGGMIPKLENAFRSIDAGVSEVVITSFANLTGGTKVTDI